MRETKPSAVSIVHWTELGLACSTFNSCREVDVTGDSCEFITHSPKGKEERQLLHTVLKHTFVLVVVGENCHLLIPHTLASGMEFFYVSFYGCYAAHNFSIELLSKFAITCKQSFISLFSFEYPKSISVDKPVSFHRIQSHSKPVSVSQPATAFHLLDVIIRYRSSLYQLSA